jgi:hypothetical protein
MIAFPRSETLSGSEEESSFVSQLIERYEN